MKKTSVNKSTPINSGDDISLDDWIIAQTATVSYTIRAIGYIAAPSARNSTKIPPKTRDTITKLLKHATDHISALPKNMRVEVILLIHKAVNIPNLTTILTNYANILNPDDSSTKYLEIIVEVFKTADTASSSTTIKEEYTLEKPSTMGRGKRSAKNTNEDEKLKPSKVKKQQQRSSNKIASPDPEADC